jgi:uncharacterized protein (DUF2062 family)
MHLMPLPPRRKPERPWWRRPLLLLLRIRLRRRHLHGSMAHKILGSRIFESHLWIPNRESAAKGIALGTFIGLLPLLGLQIIISALLCYFVRANVTAAAIATFISNPFTAAGIIWAQVKLGQWLAPALAMASVDTTGYSGLAKFLVYGKPLMIGSLVSAVAGALLAYPLTHWAWKMGEEAIRRRRARRAAVQEKAGSAASPAVEFPAGPPSSP